MDRREVFYIIGGVVVALGVAWGIRQLIPIRMTKRQAIDLIASYSKADPEKLDSMGSEYLVARAKALKSGEETFVLDGKVYSSKTGKSV